MLQKVAIFIIYYTIYAIQPFLTMSVNIDAKMIMAVVAGLRNLRAVYE